MDALAAAAQEGSWSAALALATLGDWRALESLTPFLEGGRWPAGALGFALDELRARVPRSGIVRVRAAEAIKKVADAVAETPDRMAVPPLAAALERLHLSRAQFPGAWDPDISPWAQDLGWDSPRDLHRATLEAVRRALKRIGGPEAKQALAGRPPKRRAEAEDDATEQLSPQAGDEAAQRIASNATEIAAAVVDGSFSRDGARGVRMDTYGHPEPGALKRFSASIIDLTVAKIHETAGLTKSRMTELATGECANSKRHKHIQA